MDFTRIQQFFRTPKGLLIIVLTILLALAAPTEPLSLVVRSAAAAVCTAALLDALILRAMRGAWEFPSGAVLSGMLVAMVLSPREPLHVMAGTSAIAVVSKYMFRTRFANVFNPAALALVIAFYVWNTAQNWWGALPELPPLALIVLFVAGIFIANKVNKIPLVLVFLAAYFAFFTAAAFATNAIRVAEIFRSPDLHAALFFAFFILTDPPTAPVKYRDQIVFGLIVAVVSFLMFEELGVVYYLLGGVVAGNIWEAWHRSYLISRRRLAPDTFT